MKNNIKYLIVALVLTLTVATGCTTNKTAQNVPGTPDYNMSQRITTKIPGTTMTPNTTGTGETTTDMLGTKNNPNADMAGKKIGADLNNLTNAGYGAVNNGLFGFNSNKNLNGTTVTPSGTTTGTTAGLGTTENTCQAQINKIPGVNNAHVLFNGNVAYVACDMKNPAALNTTLKNSIINTVKNSKPNVTSCYILNDNGRFNQVKAISNCVAQDGYRNVYYNALNQCTTGVQAVPVR